MPSHPQVPRSAPCARRGLRAVGHLLLCAVFGFAGAGCALALGNPEAGRKTSPSELSRDAGWVVAPALEALRQSSAADCGPTALAMVGRRWGFPVDVPQVARLVPSVSERGVKLGDLRAAARSLGMEAYAVRADRAVLVHELDAGRPVIVGLLLEATSDSPRSHYEVVGALHPAQGLVATIDPSAGWIVRTWAELSPAWEAAGRPALVVLGRAPPTAP